MNEPILGLILPPANRGVPPEALAMYPSGVDFHVECLGLEQMTPEGYDSVIDRIAPAAQRLAGGGAKAIALMGTSLTFYRGAAFNRRLTDTVVDASALPAITMSTAVVEGLRAVGSRRLAVATAYTEEVNARLRVFLEESGFEVLAIEGLGFERTGRAGGVSQNDLLDFSAGVCNRARGADAVLVSCGGFRTLEILDRLERRSGLPAVSSMPHALWAGVRLLGLSGRAHGFGSLLAGADSLESEGNPLHAISPREPH
jgi:arylmalonate decarboxylase